MNSELKPGEVVRIYSKDRHELHKVVGVWKPDELKSLTDPTVRALRGKTIGLLMEAWKVSRVAAFASAESKFPLFEIGGSWYDLRHEPVVLERG